MQPIRKGAQRLQVGRTREGAGQEQRRVDQRRRGGSGELHHRPRAVLLADTNGALVDRCDAAHLVLAVTVLLAGGDGCGDKAGRLAYVARASSSRRLGALDTSVHRGGASGTTHEQEGEERERGGQAGTAVGVNRVGTVGRWPVRAGMAASFPMTAAARLRLIYHLARAARAKRATPTQVDTQQRRPMARKKHHKEPVTAERNTRHRDQLSVKPHGSVRLQARPRDVPP